MEMMGIDKLIGKFYSGQCTAEETKAISAYFFENPDLLERYFSDEEWYTFQTDKKLPANTSASLLAGINKQVQKKPRIMPLWQRAMAAAVVLMVMAGVYLATQKTKHIRRAGHPVSSEIYVANTGKTTRQIKLSDGSTVVLEPKSEIRYLKNFEPQQRIIRLSGKAVFRVFKNTKRPFKVLSGEISTTALGTVFWVDAAPASAYIKVKLVEGKVFVATKTAAKKGYILLPGEAFLYHRKTQVARVFSMKKTGVKKASPLSESNNWYMFNNQELPEVLNQLALIYDVKIKYKHGDLARQAFIGRVEKNDTLDNTLHDIALLNNLKISRKGDTYFIGKK